MLCFSSPTQHTASVTYPNHFESATEPPFTSGCRDTGYVTVAYQWKEGIPKRASAQNIAYPRILQLLTIQDNKEKGALCCCIHQIYWQDKKTIGYVSAWIAFIRALSRKKVGGTYIPQQGGCPARQVNRVATRDGLVKWVWSSLKIPTHTHLNNERKQMRKTAVHSEPLSRRDLSSRSIVTLSVTISTQYYNITPFLCPADWLYSVWKQTLADFSRFVF